MVRKENFLADLYQFWQTDNVRTLIFCVDLWTFAAQLYLIFLLFVVVAWLGLFVCFLFFFLFSFHFMKEESVGECIFSCHEMIEFESM